MTSLGGAITGVKAVARRAGLRRARLASVRMCCERNVLATVGRRTTRAHGRILCYHAVGDPRWGVNDVSVEQFRRHLRILLDGGFRIVPAAEIVRTGGGPRDVAITFDDGLTSVLTNAAPILADYGVPWSLFVVSGWSDGQHPWDADLILRWDQIERLAADGVEIGSHSVTHANMAWLDEAELQDELGRSRRTIQDRLGIAADAFAIPLGQSTNWPDRAAELARAVGYATIYAQAEETRPPGTVARTFVTRWDSDRVFRAALGGAFDRWEEWF